MDGFFKNLFVQLSRKVYTFILFLHKLFLLSFCLTVGWWLLMKGRLLANVLNKKTEGDIRCNLAYLVNPLVPDVY